MSKQQKEDKVLKVVKGCEPYTYSNKKKGIINKTVNPPKEMFVYESFIKEVVEISCQEFDGSSYDEMSESEYMEYLDPNIDPMKVIEYFDSNGYWEDLAECESQEAFEDRLQDYINDSIVDLCPKLEENPIPTINFDSQEHYNPCEGCGREDCCCCSYGRGY